MAETSLGASELDLIEDALEELELEGSLDRWSEDELGPLVRERLTDYRSILVASREALALEDVPAGVLDGVLEQARQAAAAAPAVAVGLAAPSWWTRMRQSFMVPTLALAGTAVLVFWVVDPADPSAVPGVGSVADESKSKPEATAAAKVHIEEAPAPEPAAATPTAPLALPSDDADAEKEAEPPADEAQDGLSAESKSAPPSAKSDDRGRMGSLGEAPGNAAAGGMGSASGRWDIVSRGDRARQAGDCVAARDEYALALEDDEARVRARAFAGLGLCDAASGDEVSADANYQRARELDDAVGSFIESQNQRSRGATKKSRKPAKKSKMAVDAFDPL